MKTKDLHDMILANIDLTLPGVTIESKETLLKFYSLILNKMEEAIILLNDETFVDNGELTDAELEQMRNEIHEVLQSS